MNPTRFIVAQNRGRDPRLLSVKWTKMRANAFGYFRGSAPLFYREWTKVAPKGAPTAWISGDAHLENLGSYRGENGVPYFDINDFDECCLAPADWEIGRALATLFVLRKRDMANLFAEVFAATLAGGKPGHIEPEVARGPILALLTAVEQRNRRDFLRKWVYGEKLRPREGHLYRLGKGAKRRARRIFESWAKGQDEASTYKVLDVCGRIAGDGSLGLERYAVLVKGRKFPFIMDMKEAAPSAPRQYLKLRQPPWHCEAERVATVQHFMQYVPVGRLSYIRSSPKSYLVHELEPIIDRLDVSDLKRADYREFVFQWAHLLASAQLRTAGWKGSADLDRMIAYGQALNARAQGILLRAASSVARKQVAAWKNFRRSGLGENPAAG